MLFNSITFAIFLPIVFSLYWFVTNRSLKLQNFLILVASYVFYGWWDYRFLALIIISTGVDYVSALGIHRAAKTSTRRAWMGLSLFANLGMLGTFKYFNFFVQSWVDAWASVGVHFGAVSLDIVLPVGISFYTFQTLSYTIDVYRRKLEPTRDALSLAAFVAFFPQLVAGPIERASNLLSQFLKRRQFDYDVAVAGLQQMLWGMFKKVVIADQCARVVDFVFANYATLSTSELAVGAILFGFQIYGDFSGYSDIAIGTAKLFGFQLMTNFRYPYFSRDLAEFWRRWHVSLTTWFRDYIYIPLGGSRCGSVMKTRNILAIFLISGIWHGANWTFVVWGALNALFYLPLLFSQKNRRNLDTVAGDRLLPSAREVAQMTMTFALISLTWIFFRAENLTHAWSYLNRMAIGSLLPWQHVQISSWLVISLATWALIDWLGRNREQPLSMVGALPSRLLRWSVYFGLLAAIVTSHRGDQPFIYFQF